MKKLKFHKIGRLIGKDRTDQWIMAIKRYDLLDKPSNFLAKKFICCLHFEECMYVSGKLIQTAFPTLNLPIKLENSSKASTTTCEAPTTTIEKVKGKLNANENDMEVQSQETTKGFAEVVIKHEPPEPYEMTIEQEQIGYYEQTKRQRVINSILEDSVNIQIPKDETMYVDNRVENELTMDDTHEFCEGEIKTDSIKMENVRDYADSHVEKRAKKKYIKANLPIPSKTNLKKLLQYTKRKINTNKNKKKEACRRFLLGCDIYLTPRLSSIVKKHLYSEGDEFTDEYKMFCLNLYMSSPTTYNFLSQVLCLPSKHEMIKTYFPIDSKINEKVLRILSTLAHKMSPLDKECVLTLGEIKLKRSIFYDAKSDRLFGLHEINGQQNSCVGCYAYTAMLRGVATDWKLLIGFSFTLLNESNAGLNFWLLNTLAQLFQMGFKVRAVCCPMSPMSTHLLNTKDLLENKCYLELDGKKVYLIFDIKRILVKARNALRAGTIVMNDRKTSWTCVKQLYAVDHKKVERLAPQLTKVHLNPRKHDLNKLRYASEVLDSSVAMALNVYAEKRYLKPNFETVQFIHTMSRVFKALNCDKPITCSNEEKQLFDQTRGMLNSIIFKNSKNNLNHQFRDALTITLNSISLMGDNMQSENLVLRRSKLTYSCMKSFYDAVRQLSGHSRRVTCRKYLRAFRRCFLFHALRITEKKDTSLTNNAAFLAEYEDYVRTNKIYHTRKRKLSKDLLPVCLSTSEETRFINICSYMLQKCMEKHACPELIEYVSSSVPPAQESELAGIWVPPDHFLIYCRNLENYFQFTFNNYIGENIFKNLKKKVKKLYFDKPCKCFPVDVLLGMFVQIRIKLNNMLHNMKWKQDSTSTSNIFELIRI